MTQPSLLDLPDPRQPKAGHVRSTSVAAYQATVGKVAQRSQTVRDWLVRYLEHAGKGAPTSAELIAWVDAGKVLTTDRLLYARRGLSDLQATGTVERVPGGDRRCRVTRRRCCTWRIRQR